MELLNRYLESVRNCLPDAQRDDIISELSENLRSQIEDQEAGLGRRLTAAEVEAILKQHGHPLIVASRYRQDQRNLSFGREIIGPALFPFYLRVLKYNLGLTTLILLALFTALFLGGQVAKASIFPVFLYQFLIQFGVVTLIFSIADRHWKKHPDQWDPANLKHSWHPAFAIQEIYGIATRRSRGGEIDPKRKTSAKTNPARLSRFDSIAQLIGLVIGLAWLRIAQQAPFMIFGPAAAFLRPAPVWHTFYFPVVALFIAGMLQAAINLIRPDWVRLHLVHRLLNVAAWIVLFLFLLKAGPWVVLSDSVGSTEGYRRTVQVLNLLMIYGLAGLTAAVAYSFVRTLRRLVRLSRPDVPPPVKA